MDYRTFVENMKEQVQANLGQDYEVQQFLPLGSL